MSRVALASILVLAGAAAAACARSGEDAGRSASDVTAARRSVGVFSASNGFATIAFDAEKSRVTQFLEHPYQRVSAEVETRNFAYDTYPGVRVGSEGTWLPDQPAEKIEYVPGTGIIHAVRSVSGVTVDEYHFTPMTLPEHASVMLVKVTRTAGSGPVDAYSLFNYRLGSGGPAPSPDDEQALYVDSRKAVYEWGPANVAFAYGSIGPVSHFAMTPNNPWASLKAGEDLADNADTGGARSDAASGFQTSLGDLPQGESAWAGWFAALDTTGDAQAAADRVRAWIAGRSAADVYADEVSSWNAWTTAPPDGASEEEAALARSSQAILRMAQVRETGKSHGQILSSLAFGKRNVAHARDMAYAIVALAKTGHVIEAKQAIEFQLQAQASVHADKVGRPYKVSAAGYWGWGGEAADTSAETDAGPGAPLIAYDGFGLFLWAVDEYVREANDGTSLAAWWPVLSAEVGDVLGSLQEPSGLITKDSSIWNARWDGSERNFAFTTIAAAHGLCSAARLADRASDVKLAEAYRAAGTKAIEALRQRMRTVDGMLVQSPQALGAGRGYADLSVVEAMNFGLFHPRRATGQKTLAQLKISLGAPSGRGFMRADTGELEDSQEWVFGDLRMARALALGGDEEGAKSLLAWNVAQARANADLFAERHDRDSADYAGEVPSIGLGAGAFLLALAERGRPLEPSCGAYADEPVAEGEEPTAAPSPGGGPGEPSAPGQPAADQPADPPPSLKPPIEAKPNKLETSCHASGAPGSTKLSLPWLALGALALSRRWRRKRPS